ncbi:MAG: hypothetical protein RL497_1261 [Pseudomonadota bacterium]|jgi:protein TonB
MSALIFTYLYPATTSAERPVRRRAGVSRAARFNCLALVCVLKVGLLLLMLAHWQSTAAPTVQPVLSVNILNDDQPPAPLAAPPEPEINFDRPVITVTVPQIHFLAEPVNPPAPVQSPPQAPAAVSPAAPKADATPYHHQLMRDIARHKRYPVPAKRANQQGVVEITFEIAADGSLVSAEVSKSSQIPSLDAAALAAVTQASPFPPIPAALGLTRLRLTIPIEFSLK